MENLASFFRGEQGCATQEPGGSQTDGGGGPDGGTRQWNDQRPRVQGCFGSPDDLIPGVALGALVRQLEQRIGWALLTQGSDGRRGIGRVNDRNPTLRNSRPEKIW